MSANEFVVIHTFAGFTEAHLARVRLDAEGIESRLADEHLATVNPLLTGALGGVKLLVRAGELEDARGVIDEWQTAEDERHEAAESRCPRCGSEDIGRAPVRNTAILLLIILSLGGIVWLFFFRRHRCYDCGHAW